MRLNIDFSRLEANLRRMGAVPREIALENRLDPLEILRIELEHGIEVKLDDVDTNAGGLLSYEGHQVVLYIPDQGRGLSRAIEDASRGKKVHVADCQTLGMMKAAGRFERYVVRNGLSPMFKVSGYLDDGRFVEERELPLVVCRNCLKKLNYRGFNNRRRSEKNGIVHEFSLEQFFATYSSYFRHTPRRSADEAAGSSYAKDWDEVSRRYRESVDWCCQQCKVDLGAHPRLLHTHHRNGNRDDNSRSNLLALCVDCHSRQPMHDTMFVSKEQRRLIQRLRKEQAVYEPPKRSSASPKAWDEVLQFADPALYGLLDEIRHRGYEAPEVGADIAGKNGRIVASNVELAWPSLKEVVLLEPGPEQAALEELGWTVFLPQELLDTLQDE